MVSGDSRPLTELTTHHSPHDPLRLHRQGRSWSPAAPAAWGPAIIEAFAQAGAVCVVHYFADADGQNRRDADETAEPLPRLTGRRVHVLEADVRNYDAVEKLIREAVAGRRPARHPRQQRRHPPRPHRQAR